MGKARKKILYMDHAATTPVDPKVAKLMQRFQKDEFYNPSALYDEAIAVRRELDQVRASLASTFSVSERDILFTGGATEANNLAIYGLVWAARAAGNMEPHIIMSATEHPSVRSTVKLLAKRNLAVYSELPVGQDGMVNPKDLRELVHAGTVLITIHYTNNETGVVQPIKDIMKTVRWIRKQSDSQYPFVHLDAVQAAGYYPLGMPQLGVDMMTLSSQKNYGPKGFGVLLKRPEVRIEAQSGGGGQEAGYRPGTENVPAIIGGTTALLSAQEKHSVETERLAGLRDWFVAQLDTLDSNILVHGSRLAGDHQSPHIVSFTIPGIQGELLVIELSERGILAAARAACSADDIEPSHVLSAMYAATPDHMMIVTTGAVRLSFGKTTTKKDLEKVLKALSHIIEKYRS